MKVISYNVNGIRAAENKGFTQWLFSENPDIICLQELKAMPEQFDISPWQNAGYHVILNSAEKKGYSGVALISKEVPLKITKGIGIEKFDIEGRVIRADFKNFTQISVYIPSGSMGDARQEFKMEFLEAFYQYIQALLKEHPTLIISGDYNICHKPIDINHPELHNNASGFLPEEREWLDRFFALGLTDSFRVFNQEPEQYSWWSYRQRSREKNLGWRIDYHATAGLDNQLKNASILSQVVHSDHCPVVVELA
ncbi:MAG: exodeoxyribonuclease III [Bacteroidetes bacterium HGW-Bacteroidetes-21]|jgi:exodeoxyribonuclease-3|nr:MAG: exodeoxyribonuclease III [Bacteroidetes bacterium HGW-Bacteroidetes-21]